MPRRGPRAPGAVATAPTDQNRERQPTPQVVNDLEMIVRLHETAGMYRSDSPLGHGARSKLWRDYVPALVAEVEQLREKSGRDAWPQPGIPILLERLGPWRWRATLEAWEEHGITRRAALRNLRMRYGITPHVGHTVKGKP